MSLFIFEVINREAEVCKFYMAIFDKNVSKFYITVLLKDSKSYHIIWSIFIIKKIIKV